MVPSTYGRFNNFEMDELTYSGYATGTRKKDSMFPASSAFYGSVGTPLVKLKTSNNTGSPRVQMFRTRVVHNENSDANIRNGSKLQEASV